jgi:glutamate synthase domain-containing protein 3
MYQLIGITDTSMLRPQVFSLYDGEVQIGLVCSEKQAIDSTLRSLSDEDPRFSPIADKYWNARGGSFDDGGTFMFNVSPVEGEGRKLACFNKFGDPVVVESRKPLDITAPVVRPADWVGERERALNEAILSREPEALVRYFAEHAVKWDYNTLRWTVNQITRAAVRKSELVTPLIKGLTLVLDGRFPLGEMKRSALVWIVTLGLYEIFDSLPRVTGSQRLGHYCLIDFDSRRWLRPPIAVERTLVINASAFPPEGDACDAILMSDAHEMGWRNFIVYDLRGQRFQGCGLGPKTEDVRVDLYGSSGDYVASGLDGMKLVIHGNAQDQVGQIMKRGTLVIHGDTGQCFLYGAKGGSVYVRGNAAGRPLINAAGNPRVVINGTALDFLAESFMAGDPLNGGGFVIVNGLTMDEDGNLVFLDRPYPGSNLFSLASGGALYVRDPNRAIVDEQLNGGALVDMTAADWELIEPYLRENERHFGIAIDQLLTVDGKRLRPADVYRKVEAVPLAVLRTVPSTDDSVWAAGGGQAATGS